MSQKFSLSSSVILRSEPQYYDTYAAFDHKRVRTEFLMEEEFRALEYIYDRPADVKIVSKESGMNYVRCERFLKRMVQLGYVQVGAESLKVRSPERVKVDPQLYSRFPIPFLSAPTSVDVFITSRCNLNCVHCFSRGGEGTIHELSLNDLESIFNQLERMGILEVRINGGEPLLHPEIGRVLLALKGKRFRRVIITNGTLMDEEMVALLKESETIPTVSLDDSEMEEHDIFRGVKGSFKRTVEALKLLQKTGVQYGINCCLHKRNLNRYREIIDLVAKHGTYRIAFLDLKVVGRMKNHVEWVPSYREYQEAMFNLMVDRFRYRRRIDVALDVFLHCKPLKESIMEAREGYVSCQAGKTSLSIDSEGSVYPCNLVLSDPKWRMGNIKNEKIWDLWFSQKWLFFRGGVKISELKKCRGCKDLMRCKDFYCRLLPYATSGDPFGPHPKCS
ncbi:MAG: radical SAM protein [archaeon]|nr:radical SAM protein [archaeon]